MTLPSLAVAFLWRVILTSEGQLNRFINFTNISAPIWLSTKPIFGGDQFSEWNMAHLTALLVESWIWVPFVIAVVVILTGYIQQNIIEAAVVEGDSQGKIYWSIVVPLIIEPLALVFLLRFVDSYRVFETYWVLFKSNYDIRPYSIEVYVEAVGKMNFIKGAQLALIGLCIGILAAFIIFIIVRKLETSKKTGKKLHGPIRDHLV